MADNSYYVEFPNHDAALKFQERYKFLLGKYQRLNYELTKLKQDKLVSLTNFLNLVKQLEAELTECKNLIPKPKGLTQPRTITHKRGRKKKKALKKTEKTSKIKPKKSLSELRAGLEDIRSQLTEM